MKRLKSLLITISCITAAVILYFAGVESGAAALLACGVILETVFWIRVIRFRRFFRRSS